MVNSYYRCTVGGEYFKKEAGGEVTAPYEIEVNVPDLGPNATDNHYLSVIKRNLLTKCIKAKYNSVIAFRTHEMIDRVLVTPSGAPAAQAKPAAKAKSVSQMNKTELINYIEVNGYPIDLEIYNTVDKMRKAIAAHDEDAEAFVKEQDDLRAEIELQKTLSELNPVESTSNGAEGTEESPENIVE